MSLIDMWRKANHVPAPRPDARRPLMRSSAGRRRSLVSGLEPLRSRRGHVRMSALVPGAGAFVMLALLLLAGGAALYAFDPTQTTTAFTLLALGAATLAIAHGNRAVARRSRRRA